MEPLPEYEAYGARPRRQTRLPVRYADYDVDRLGYINQRHRQEEDTSRLEGKARMTPLTSPNDSPPPRHLNRREANFQEMDFSYGAGSQQLFPEREPRDRFREYSTHLPTSLHHRPPHEDDRVELENIRQERLLLQQTQRRMSSDIDELKALRADMRQLVDTVRNLQSPSLHSNKAELTVMQPPAPFVGEPDSYDEDDWPAPPPWPDPVSGELLPGDYLTPHHPNGRPDELPPKEEVVPAPVTQPSVRQQHAQHSAHGALPATQSKENYADYSTPWYQAAQPSPRPPSLAAPEPKYQVYGGHRSEPSINPVPPPQPPPHRSWTQPLPPRPALISEPRYHGPRPTIRNFSSRDPSEFARLKISLENLLPPSATELFKYQVLVDHLQLEDARLIADAYLNSPTPFSDTMAALNDKFGQPHQIALKRIAAVMDSPDIKRGDVAAFEKFALQIQSLVGMLRTIGSEGEVELQCGSHVARLLSKLPPEQRADFRRCMFRQGSRTHNLIDLAEWLKYESWCQDSEGQLAVKGSWESSSRPEGRQGKHHTTVLHGAKDTWKKPDFKVPGNSFNGNKSKPYCPYCNNEDHYLSQCTAVTKLNKEQLTAWIKTNKRCWRCARPHQAAQCNLKKTCGLCQGKHLQVLHDVNLRPPKETASAPTSQNPGMRATTEVLYLDRPAEGSQVLLKVVKVRIHYKDRFINTYAILDDGSERTMLLPEAVEKLGVQGTPEDLPLRTIRQDVQTLRGASVSFFISSPAKPKTRFKITGAFTTAHIGLADHTYPMEQLREKYKHLIGLPIQTLTNAKPLLLLGSDHPHLVTPIEPVRLGPKGGPAAIHTRLGWTLQGPASVVYHLAQPQQCLFTSVTPQVSELMKHVEMLWQVDTLPFRSEKLVTRSREDQEAIGILETKTIRVEVNSIRRYVTPLLRRKDMPLLQATKEAVMHSLRSIERRLAKNPTQAEAYKVEMEKLIKAGSVIKCDPEVPVEEGRESWYIPHHMVSHNGKNRLVFNCSFQYRGQNLNDYLLPGPTLGASLLGVLLRFREHAVAISGDIKGMFHQVRLLPEDRDLLRFVWRDSSQDPPAVYEWQVLPFGTTCSPCCATFALQRHVIDHSQPDEEVRSSVEKCFYVDNCLQSVPTISEAKHLVDKLRAILASAGFELRQWASNQPEVISHLPEESRSTSVELWLAQNKTDVPESTLGLSWLFQKDVLGYKHRPVDYGEITMRNIYKVLASQYDPLGFILPYTTRAKILVRHLWDKHRGWDDPLLPQELLQQWKVWEEELQVLPQVNLPRPYIPKEVDISALQREVHIFCDASEEAYGSVAYLRTTDRHGVVYLSFLMARSRVAPKRFHSMPRLELCAALTGAQLSQVLARELTINIDRTILWSDSTTVLTWLKSESCRFKVFVGARVAEIQELTDRNDWRYVDSARNSADDVTRGKKLKELIETNRWSQGPPFLLLSPDLWPEDPAVRQTEDASELRKSTFCGVTAVASSQPIADPSHPNSWKELLEVTVLELHGAAKSNDPPTAEDFRQAERLILQRAQRDSFLQEYSLLKAGKPVLRSSRLLTLSPELDESGELIHVGGRLRQAEDLELTALHPIILDSGHWMTKLLIQDFDSRLHHPGPERVFAEIRRSFWILRGREAVRRYQHSCADCQRWRARPAVPKMADLPAARLRLFKPPFFSTGMDCFGPFQVKVGRRLEKRWGIIFKCLTTRAVYLDLLTAISSDAFLMALRRFIARRGTPAELFSDQGTNFKGGERELSEAFKEMAPDLQQLLAPQKIAFHFNPPAAPHFGGVWEREIRSVKSALYATVGAQPVPEEVLNTVLTEVEGILNSKPLGYVSSDASDPDPVTPNVLLMGRPDGSLPQVVYPESELISRRRWKHSQVLADHFWARFMRLYLPSLQARQKWQATPADIKEDAVVMIADPHLPRALWPIGTVVKTHPSSDGHIRSADVKVKERVYTRPVAKLVVLPALPSGEYEDSFTPAIASKP